jgi:ATP-dependent Clp protease ATP-binding subunit ClpC
LRRTREFGIGMNLVKMLLSLFSPGRGTSMFEKYTEKARRTIFFARYEASQYGSPYIETEHLLLGLLREDKALSKRFLRARALDDIRKQIESHTENREKVSTSVDLPLSNENKRVLAHAAEEADRLGHRHIGTEHLLLGLLREEKCFAAELLREQGLQLATVRGELKRLLPEQPGAAGDALLAQFTTDLTDQAMLRGLPPIVGRQSELQRLIQVLGRGTKKNPLLVGEVGVGKRSLVQALAQHIAERHPDLAGKRILEFDIGQALVARRASSMDFAGEALAELVSSPDAIYFIPELYSVLLSPPEKAWWNAAELLKDALLQGKLQCIGAASPEEKDRVNERHPWLARCFSVIDVPEPSEEESIKILMSARDRMEKYHSVTYTEEAIRSAVTYSRRYVKNRFLPDKALDLMDEAGAYVRAHVSAPPQEILELRNKLRGIIKALEDSIAHHEFQKARLYSEEEKQVRENLRTLGKEHGIDEAGMKPVTQETIEEVIAGWLAVPVNSIRSDISKAE